MKGGRKEKNERTTLEQKNNVQKNKQTEIKKERKKE